MIRKIKLQLGQSLVELMIGLAVVGIALTAILSLTTKSMQLTEVAEYRKKAVVLARSEIEDIKKDRDFATSWGDFRLNYPDTVNVDSKTVEAKGTTYDVTTTVSEKGTDVMLEIEVEVDWTDVSGVHTVDDYTLITKWR